MSRGFGICADARLPVGASQVLELSAVLVALACRDLRTSAASSNTEGSGVHEFALDVLGGAIEHAIRNRKETTAARTNDEE